MSVLRPLDPAFLTARRISLDAAPLVLVTVFTLGEADQQAFLQACQDDALFMKRQPRFISNQLHRTLGEKPGLPERWIAAHHSSADASSRLSGRSRCPASAPHGRSEFAERPGKP